jgi:hypothetical protein
MRPFVFIDGALKAVKNPEAYSGATIAANNWGNYLLKRKMLTPGEPGKTGVNRDFIVNGAYYDITEFNTGQKISPTLFWNVPVFADIVLSDLAGKTTVQLLQALCFVSRQKSIVKTTVQGRDGSIKEFINNGDYQLSIKGAFANPDMNHYPLSEITDLVTLSNLNEAINVTSDYLEGVYGICNIVIENIDIRQEEGKQNMLMFDIKATSDEAVELTVSNE